MTDPFFADREKARKKIHNLEHRATHLQQQGQPVQARAAMTTAAVLRALWGVEESI